MVVVLVVGLALGMAVVLVVWMGRVLGAPAVRRVLVWIVIVVVVVGVVDVLVVVKVIVVVGI